MPVGPGLNSVLASSPAAFAGSHLIRKRHPPLSPDIALSLTKSSLEIRLPLLPLHGPDIGCFMALLGCGYVNDRLGQAPKVGLWLITRPRKRSVGATNEPEASVLHTVSARYAPIFLVYGVSDEQAPNACQSLMVPGSGYDHPHGRLRLPDSLPIYSTCRVTLGPRLRLVASQPQTSWNLKAGVGTFEQRDSFTALSVQVDGAVSVVLVMLLDSVFQYPRMPVIKLVDSATWPNMLDRLQAYTASRSSASPSTNKAVGFLKFSASTVVMMKLLGCEIADA